MKGINCLLRDDSFSIDSQPAIKVHRTATKLSTWITKHPDKGAEFEKKLVSQLSTCMQTRGQSQKVRKERMWSAYHQVRSSTTYLADWKVFLQESVQAEMSPVFSQYVGHYIFKEFVKLHHPLEPLSDAAIEPLTDAETNALRYAAGYVPRMLKNKMKKSTHPLKEDIQLCLLDLLNDGHEESGECTDWVELVNRGGLTLVNNTTFELFLVMEYELREPEGRER